MKYIKIIYLLLSLVFAGIAVISILFIWAFSGIDGGGFNIIEILFSSYMLIWLPSFLIIKNVFIIVRQPTARAITISQVSWLVLLVAFIYATVTDTSNIGWTWWLLILTALAAGLLSPIKREATQ